MKFNSRITRQKTIPCEPGSKFADTYEIRIDENGKKEVYKTGETNLYQRIQEALTETLIQNILDRAALGDPEALNRAAVNYLDTTDMPKTLAEAQNTIIRIQNEFEKLPIDIKRQFDFSAEKYVAQYGTETWFKALNIAANIAAAEPEAEAKPKKNTEKEEPANE